MHIPAANWILNSSLSEPVTVLSSVSAVVVAITGLVTALVRYLRRRPKTYTLFFSIGDIEFPHEPVEGAHVYSSCFGAVYSDSKGIATVAIPSTVKQILVKIASDGFEPITENIHVKKDWLYQFRLKRARKAPKRAQRRVASKLRASRVPAH